jgi:hypothetical protein
MRLMSVGRLAVLAVVALGVTLSVGAVGAGAQGSTTVLKFYDAGGQSTGVGFNANNPNAVPPVGSSIVTTLRLQNIGSQFGKPSGTTVGRVALQCTVLVVNSPEDVDGVCSGIAHVPNGYFTFGGNGSFVNAHTIYFDVTGGVGAYANDRGEIKVVNSASGSSDATVTLYSS